MRRALIVIGAAIVLMVGGAFAYASIPAADGTITGCVNKTSGVVRIIDTAKTSCTKNEDTVPWNQAGQPGQDGANGTNGVSGYQAVTKSETFTPVAGQLNTFIGVSCPPGKHVTGGGAFGDLSSSGGSNVQESSPSVSGDIESWFAIVGKASNAPFNGTETIRVTVTVFCIDAV